MEIRRFKDIIAFKNYDTEISANDHLRTQIKKHKRMPLNEKLTSVIAFHARNLEVAEITEEAFNEMSPILLSTSDAPDLLNTVDPEACEQIENWNQDQNFEGRTGHLQFGIRAITLNVTQICNLKCHYCAAGGDGTYGDPVAKISIEKTLPQLKFFIDQLKENQKFTISFVGGEPLLYPEALLAIYNYVTSLSVDRKNVHQKKFFPIFSLTTNGTLITENTVQILKQMDIHITVSLDGDKNINDLSRPTKDGSSSTLLTESGLAQLIKIKNDIGSFGISAVCTETEMNILESYHYFKKFNPDWYEFNFSYIEKSHHAQAKYLAQMSELAAETFHLGGELELRKIKTFDHYFKLLDDQQRIENHCGAGKSYLMIDARNQIYTCPWVVGESSEIVGKGSDLDYALLQKYQKPLIELNNCQTCWARYLCGGGCMYIHRTHTGDKHTKDSLFCERTRGLILIAIMYYKLSRE